MKPADLTQEWRTRAEMLERHGAKEAAATCRELAAELDAALREGAEEPLTLVEAAKESGYSQERLRHMIANGIIPQAGRRGAPRVRRSDLPRKQRSRSSGFDPAAAARRTLQAVS